MHSSNIMTHCEIIRNNLNKSDWEITKDKCDSTRAHRRHLAANGKHENKRKFYCTNVPLRIIEILITLMYELSAVILMPLHIYHTNACPDLGWPRGGEEHHEQCHHQEPTSWRETAEKQKDRAIPEWRAAPKRKEHPTEPTAPWTSAEENTFLLGNINPLTKNVSTSPGKPLYTPSHPTDTCTVSPVKVAPSASEGAPSTMAPSAYHPYQMPMVQKSYTKAVEESNMPQPQFNGQLESYN